MTRPAGYWVSDSKRMNGFRNKELFCLFYAVQCKETENYGMRKWGTGAAKEPQSWGFELG